MKQVIVEITPDGGVVIAAKGYTGADCEQATAALEAALGVVAARQHTPEYRQTVTQKRSQQQGQGG